MFFYLILILVFAIVVAGFGISNTQLVVINFMQWKTQEISLALVILISALAGVIFAGLIGVMEQIRMRWMLYKVQGVNREYERRLRDYDARFQELHAQEGIITDIKDEGGGILP